MIDVAAVPDGLKNSVGETKSQNVLNGFFAQIMVDPINLSFVGNLQQLLVQIFRAFEVMPEGFLDNHSPPVFAPFMHQSHPRQLFDDRPEVVGGGGQIVQMITVGGVLGVHFVEGFFQARIKIGVFEIAVHIVQPAQEPLPKIAVHTVAGKLLDIVSDPLAEFVFRDLSARHPDHREFARQQLIGGQIVERRNQLAAGEVSGRAENHHGAGISRSADSLLRHCRQNIRLGHLHPSLKF